jgi:hypothetical protein
MCVWLSSENPTTLIFEAVVSTWTLTRYKPQPDHFNVTVLDFENAKISLTGYPTATRETIQLALPLWPQPASSGVNQEDGGRKIRSRTITFSKLSQDKRIGLLENLMT